MSGVQPGFSSMIDTMIRVKSHDSAGFRTVGKIISASGGLELLFFNEDGKKIKRLFNIYTGEEIANGVDPACYYLIKDPVSPAESFKYDNLLYDYPDSNNTEEPKEPENLTSEELPEQKTTKTPKRTRKKKEIN